MTFCERKNVYKETILVKESFFFFFFYSFTYFFNKKKQFKFSDVMSNKIKIADQSYF